jgi:hypothetical protein
MTDQNPSTNPQNGGANTPPRLQLLIAQSNFISDSDKAFLIANLDGMKPLDRLQLEQTLMSGMVPESLQQVARLRQQFMAKEAPKASPDIITKFIQSVAPPAQKTMLSQSVLLKPHLSGTPTPQPFVPNPMPAVIPSLAQFTGLNQLITLNPAHVTFGVNDPVEQIINDFLNKIDKMFSTLPDMITKRSYLMSFMQSLLFRIYLSTGETALRHPELQPRSVALNQMYQIDNRKYLNKNQFQYTSRIINHLRSLAAL